MSVFQAFLLVLLALLAWIAWRILRCLEWMATFVKGFSEKFVETSRRLREEEGR